MPINNIVNFILLLLITIYLYQCDDLKRVKIIVLIIFFPLSFTFLGKDSLTVGTIVSCFFSINYLYRVYCKKELSSSFCNIVVVLLIVIASLSTLAFSPSGFAGPALRKLVYFNSSLLLFLYVTNLTFSHEQKKLDFIESLLSVIIFSVGLQVLISVLMINFPETIKIFNYFKYANAEGYILEEGRARSLVLTPESYGEILAVLSPVLLYKISFKKPQMVFLFFLVVFGFGLILSGTRSGIALFVFGSMLFYALYPQKSDPKLWAVLLSIIAIFSFSVLYYPKTLINVIDRFSVAYSSYSSGEDISTIINRENIWDTAYVINNLSIIGKGVLPAFHSGGVTHHFHNLYLTIIFQLGILGSILYFSLFFHLFKKLLQLFKGLRNYTIGVLCLSAIISFLLFFINEVKFEFNRYEAYQQICWALFGAYFLLGSMKTSLGRK